MKLPDDIILKIQRHVTFDISTSLGCTLLAREISNTLHDCISGNTLKRAFGIISSSSNTSQYTLNLIARYIGYTNWDNFLNNQLPETSSFNNKTTSLSSVKTGQTLTFYYSPNRVVSMKCIGPNKFIVTSSHNSQLLAGDTVTACQITKYAPLELTDVMRNGKNIGCFTAAIHDGITHFTIE